MQSKFHVHSLHKEWNRLKRKYLICFMLFPCVLHWNSVSTAANIKNKNKKWKPDFLKKEHKGIESELDEASGFSCQFLGNSAGTGTC